MNDALIAIGTLVVIGVALLINVVKYNHENKKRKK
jgi:hypothetical protein